MSTLTAPSLRSRSVAPGLGPRGGSGTYLWEFCTAGDLGDHDAKPSLEGCPITRERLEFMSPKYRHEKPAARLRPVGAWRLAEVMDIPWTQSRSTTFRLAGRGSGQGGRHELLYRPRGDDPRQGRDRPSAIDPATRDLKGRIEVESTLDQFPGKASDYPTPALEESSSRVLAVQGTSPELAPV